MNLATEVRIRAGQPTLDGNEAAYVADCLRRSQLSMGGYVRLFEERMAATIGVKHAIATMNGTAALHLALAAWGIGPDDEVIVPALTFVATANAVSYCGARPVIVDVERDSWCIDPVEVKAAITPHTRAIIPVHLYGVPANMAALRQIAEEYGVLLVEDAAEAIGGKVDGAPVGSLGETGCFSFYGNKTITTGEGGMITTDDDDLADRLRLLRGQGQTDVRYWHDVIGFNYRMTEIQGAIGCGQLESLDRFLEARQRVMASYQRLLSRLTFQALRPQDTHGCWAAAVLLPEAVERHEVMRAMEARGIETRPVFYPLNVLPMYYGAGCSVAGQISLRGIVLPVYPTLSDEDIGFLCSTLEDILDGR